MPNNEPAPPAAGELPTGTLEAKVRHLIRYNAKHRDGTRLGTVNWETVFEHLRKEINELECEVYEPGELSNAHSEAMRSELGDILGIVVHAVMKAGFTMAEVEQREIAKLDERFEVAVPFVPATATDPGCFASDEREVEIERLKARLATALEREKGLREAREQSRYLREYAQQYVDATDPNCVVFRKLFQSALTPSPAPSPEPQESEQCKQKPHAP